MRRTKRIVRCGEVAVLVILMMLERHMVKILERAETMGDVPTPRRLWENVTRQIMDRVTLCYFRFAMLFPG